MKYALIVAAVVSEFEIFFYGMRREEEVCNATFQLHRMVWFEYQKIASTVWTSEIKLPNCALTIASFPVSFPACLG